MISNRFAKWNFVAISIVLLLLYFGVGPFGGGADFQKFIARVHPAIVHLPIGIIIFGFVLMVLKSVGWVKDGENALNLTLVLGSWFGAFAIAAGMWLVRMGGYPAETLFRHKLAGFVIVLLAAIVLFVRTSAKQNQSSLRVEHGLWVVLVLALSIGGDLGGRLTHGEAFASQYAPGLIQPLLGNPDMITGRFDLAEPASTTIFDGIIEPIFVEKCSSCHGAERGKGRLRLHSAEAIQSHKGDDPLIVAGNPDASLLVQRISLPDGHDDQMPPPLDAKPISHADVELIRWWITEGGSFDMVIADANIPPAIHTILDAYGLGEIKHGIFALDIAQPDTNVIAALRNQGARVERLSENSPFLSVNCSAVSQCFEGDALANLGQHVAWLDAGQSDVTDAHLSVLANLPNLVRLDLSKTGVSGSGLSAVSDLSFLEYLNVYGSMVDDAALEHLASVKSLKSLYVWQSKVTPEGAARLEQALPNVVINTGAAEAPAS